MVVRIADAGFIVALNNGRRDEERWARGELAKWRGPFITCEGALIEAAHFVGPDFVADLVERQFFTVAFDLVDQIEPIRALLGKYGDQEMDLTDACIVRMTEIFPDCLVFTVDHDFDVYRRFRNERIPTMYPS
jgi:hypothetical protein